MPTSLALAPRRFTSSPLAPRQTVHLPSPTPPADFETMPVSEIIPPVVPHDGSEGDGDISIQRGTSDSEWLDNESAYHANDGVLSSSLGDDHADLNYSDGREGRKSAFYDYKQEKILKQTDAKLFYQQQQGSGWNSPIMRASTWGATGGNVSRAASVRSFNSSHQHPHTHSHGQQYLGPAAGAAIGSVAGFRGMPTPAVPVGLEKPKEYGGVQVPEMSRFDPHDIASAQDIVQSQYHISSQEEGALLAPRESYVDSRCS